MLHNAEERIANLQRIRNERVAHDMAASELMSQTREAVRGMVGSVEITDLAIWAGVSRQTIYAWIRGEGYIPPVR